MIGRILGIILSVFGLLMPWRLRVFYSEILGWITQFIYFTYYGIFNFLLKELKNKNVDIDSDLQSSEDDRG